MNILARRLHVESTASLPGWRHRETEYRQRAIKLDPSNSNLADAYASRLCPISASRLMTISSARNGTLPTCAHFNDVMMTFASAVNALPSLWPSVTTTPSRPALSLAANLTQRHSARQKLAASRAVICGNRRNRMVRRPCGDGNDDHGEARGRALHLRKITAGARIPGCQSGRLRCSGAGYPCRPGLSLVHPPGGRHYPAARDRVRLGVRSQGARHRGARRRGPLPRAARCTSARTCGDVMQAAAPHA